MTPDDVWAAIRDEVDNLNAALGGAPVATLTPREQTLMRLAGLTGWRLATDAAADHLAGVPR